MPLTLGLYTRLNLFAG